ncbi:dermonecrotic toxin domain-containing protein [Pseudomonas putida]|uniref:dermonecrotic toxin domain-containing protein n=1 Tax=Pseudomonas putida TaxID=303 RepID=UPI00300EF274
MSPTTDHFVPHAPRDVIAAQFATRPTLRQVLDTKLFDALVERYPQLSRYFPERDSAAGFAVTFERNGKIDLEGLGSVLLDWLVQGRSAAFTPEHHLTTEAPTKGLGEVVEHSGLQSLNVRLDELNAVFDEILASLIEAFQRAQLDYWNAEARPNPDEAGVGRHRWMQQALRMALASGVSRARLEDEERAYLNEMLLGVSEAEVATLAFSWADDEREQVLMPGDLLIEAERDDRKLFVWCTLSGAVKAFRDVTALSEALQDHLAGRCRFEKLTWRRLALDGDVFMQQSGMLLNLLLDDVEQVRLSSMADGAELEAVMGVLTDPSRYLLDEERSGAIDVSSGLPEWLSSASSRDRFEYQVALLDVSIAQALSKGQSSLGDLEDLHSYAARRLREQLLEDYPSEANYFPDDLILSVSIPDPTVDKELPVTLKDGGSITLTELAIGHLDALSGGVISGIRHRENQLIMDWMTPVYIAGLIERVDIGGTYPRHVAERLNEPSTLATRTAHFGREWRFGLLFDALKAKVEGYLSESAWRALAEFCRSGRDLKANVTIAPLAFQAQSGWQGMDQVTCMYAIVLTHPSVVLLYRPLYAKQTLLQYDDQRGLMEALGQAGELQDSVLAWLPESARSIYANGGFIEPHLHRPILDTTLLPGRVEPPRLKLRSYLADIDVHMFASKRAALIELADRQSVSNAEHRWAVVKQFGWMFFDLVAPVLPGLLGRIATVVGILSPFLEETPAAGRELSDTVLSANLVIAIAMALMHGRQGEVAVPSRTLRAESLYKPIARRPSAIVPSAPVEFTLDTTIGTLQEQVGPVSLGHGWGQGPVTQRKALAAYVATVDLTEAIRANGLERVGEQFYVVIDGNAYRVLHDDHGRRIVGPHGEPGPLLVDDGVWRIRADGFLFGGAGRRRGRAAQEQYDRALSECTQQIRALYERQPTTSLLHRTCLRLDAELDTLAGMMNRFGQMPDEQADQRAQLVAKTQERKADKLREYRQAAQAYVQDLQELIAQNKRLIERLGKAVELKTRQPALTSRYSTEQMNELILDSRVQVIKYGHNVIARLLTIMGHDELDRLEAAIRGRTISEVRDQYLAYKRCLRGVADINQQMIEASATLDEFIVQVPVDQVIEAAGENQRATTLGDWISARTVTTEDLMFEQAVFHMELSFRLEEQGAAQMVDDRRKLVSDALVVASNAHAQLPVSNLPAADRIDVLQVAWDEYSGAIINSIDIRREGSAYLDLAMLEVFEQDLRALKQSANLMLIDAMRESESRVPLAPRRRAYPVEQAQQLVVYGQDGQIAIGRQVDADGTPVVEVTRRFGDKAVLKRFDLVGGVWTERVPAPPVVDGNDAELARQATFELALDKPLQRMIEAKALEGVSTRDLKKLLDTHIDRLRTLAEALPDKDGFTHRKLVEVLNSWTQRRQDLLVKIYVDTPYPEAEGLRYLHEQQRIAIKYRGPRQVLQDNSAMDEYAIHLRGSAGGKPGKIIWAAHFHFDAADALPAEFSVGHLKTWEQRFMSARDAQALAERGQRLHRGRLTHAQASALFSEAWNRPS